MDIEGNHRMDWFFDEYVYGTDLPTYHFEGQVTPNGDGNTLHIKLTQSGVPPDFKMLVPLSWNSQMARCSDWAPSG